MYPCDKDIATSNKNKTRIIPKPTGTTNDLIEKIPEMDILNKNTEIESNNIWPATILENNRKAKLITLVICESTSTIHNNGTRWKAIPSGKNMENNPNPCFSKPYIKAAPQARTAKEKVTIEWLVNAKLYGINPTKLRILMNKKMNKMKGKKYLVSSFG